ncbi:MAG: hypothetical protein J7L43_01625 [Candidatus Aenigmarchaeota archaeon]|nr:hypothetical protein [Candidatus Aenigmarchaeota archaeon]
MFKEKKYEVMEEIGVLDPALHIGMNFPMITLLRNDENSYALLSGNDKDMIEYVTIEKGLRPGYYNFLKTFLETTDEDVESVKLKKFGKYALSDVGLKNNKYELIDVYAALPLSLISNTEPIVEDRVSRNEKKVKKEIKNSLKAFWKVFTNQVRKVDPGFKGIEDIDLIIENPLDIFHWKKIKDFKYDLEKRVPNKSEYKEAEESEKIEFPSLGFSIRRDKISTEIRKIATKNYKIEDVIIALPFVGDYNLKPKILNNTEVYTRSPFMKKLLDDYSLDIGGIYLTINDPHSSDIQVMTKDVPEECLVEMINKKSNNVEYFEDLDDITPFAISKKIFVKFLREREESPEVS